MILNAFDTFRSVRTLLGRAILVEFGGTRVTGAGWGGTRGVATEGGDLLSRTIVSQVLPVGSGALDARIAGDSAAILYQCRFAISTGRYNQAAAERNIRRYATNHEFANAAVARL